MTRWWVNFVHVFLALTGYWAAAAALWHRNRFLASSSLLWFLLGLHRNQRCFHQLLAVNPTRKSPLRYCEPANPGNLEAKFARFRCILDRVFLVLIIQFLLGTLFLGLAAIGGAGLDRWLGVLLLLAVPLTVVILLSEYASITGLGPVVAWSYPVLQPVSRALMAVWLWRTAARNLSTSHGLSPAR